MAIKHYNVIFIAKIDATDKTKARQAAAELIVTKYPDPWDPVKSLTCMIEEEKEAELTN